MTAEKHPLADWSVWVVSYAVAYLMVFAGTALSIYLWAAPFEQWGEILRLLFWRSFLYAIPLALILGVAWRKSRARSHR